MKFSLRSLMITVLVLPPLIAAAYFYGPIAVRAFSAKRPKLIILFEPTQSMKTRDLPESSP